MKLMKTLAVSAAALCAMSTILMAHLGRKDSSGCHAGKQPYHCHGGGNTVKNSTPYTGPIIPVETSEERIPSRAVTPILKRAEEPETEPVAVRDDLVRDTGPSAPIAQPTKRRELYKYDGQRYDYDPMNPFKPRLK